MQLTGLTAEMYRIGAVGLVFYVALSNEHTGVMYFRWLNEHSGVMNTD